MAARRHDPDSAGPAPDPHRPRVHFTPQSTWMNDPNGLVLHEGRWHLFFQNNPLGSTPGNLSWGHAVSDDLASWTHLPVALRFSEEEWIFSGSVVHDAENRSGLGIPGDDGPLLAFYTSAYTPAHPTLPSIQAQSVAASTDGGTTWTRFAGNPVLDRGSRDFRDPKVLWHAESAHWVMVTVEAEEYELHLYTSEDLLTWEHASVFTHPEIDGGIWECPDLVHVRTGTEAEGAAASAWVLVLSTNPGGPAGGSGTYTLLGDFDGRTFTTHRSPQPLDLGQDCYAAVSFSGVEGDPVLLGWMNNWAYAAQTPTAPWRSAMTLPRTLQLEADGVGDPALVQRLVVPDGTRTVTLEEVAGGPPLDLAQPLRLHGVLPARSPWRLTLRLGDPEGDLDLVLSGDPTSGVVLDRGAAHEAPFAVEHPRSLPYVPAGGDDEVIVDLVVDRSCVEVELDRGRGTISQQVFHGTWQMSVLLQLDD